MSSLGFEWAGPFGKPTFYLLMPCLLHDYHQADTLLFRRGMPQMGCVDSFSSAADLQSYLHIALRPDIQSCDEQCWALLHFLADSKDTVQASHLFRMVF